MADTFSVRANEEIQKRFREYVEKSDFNQNDFLSQLLTIYAAHEVSRQIPIMDTAVKAIRTQTETVTRILIGVGESLMLEQKRANEQIEVKKTEMDQRISAAESDRNELKNQNNDLQEQLKEKVVSLADSITHEKELEEKQSVMAELLSSNREKIDTLEGLLTRQKKDVEDAEIAIANNEKLVDRVTKQDLRIQQLEAEKMTIEAEKAHELNQIQQELTEKISTLNEQHMKAFNDYEARANAYIEQVKSMQAQISEYEAYANVSVEQVKAMQNQISEQQAEIEILKQPKRQSRKPQTKKDADLDKTEL